MEIVTTKKFNKSYKKLPKNIQERFNKQLKILLNDLSHPSLEVKKIKRYDGIFEGRINKNYRFLFSITSKSYILYFVGNHDEVLR